MIFVEFGILALLTLILLAIWFRHSSKTVYMGQTQQLSSTTDVTTIHPVPIHAATCDHDWETITDQRLEMPHEKKVVVILNCRRCGMLDKTVQITTPPPPPLPLPPPPPAPPCDHDWQSVSEQMLEVDHEKRYSLVLTCRKCGSIDKTSAVTSKAPEPHWTKEQCRHKWEKEKAVTLDSAYEQMLKSIKVAPTGYGQKTTKVDPEKKLLLDLNKAPAWMFRKSYVCVRVCTVCGDIDKIVTSNFDIEGEIEGEDTFATDAGESIKIKKKA